MQTAGCGYLKVNLFNQHSWASDILSKSILRPPSIHAHRDFCKDGLGDALMRSVVVNTFDVIPRFFGVRNEYLKFSYVMVKRMLSPPLYLCNLVCNCFNFFFVPRARRDVAISPLLKR